jgi:hypothetical protein
MVELGDLVWVRYWDMPGRVVGWHSGRGNGANRFEVKLANGRTSVWHTHNPTTEPTTPYQEEWIRHVFGVGERPTYVIMDTPDSTYGTSRADIAAYIRRCSKELGWVP